MSHPPTASHGTSGTPEPPTWRLLVCEEPAMPAGTGLGLVRPWGLRLVFLRLDLHIYCIAGRDPQACPPCKDSSGSVWVPHTALISPMSPAGTGGHPGLFPAAPSWPGLGSAPLRGRSCGPVPKELGPCTGTECLATPMMQGWPPTLRTAPGTNSVFGVCLCVFFKK